MEFSDFTQQIRKNPNWVKQGVPLVKFDFTWEYRLVVIFLFIIGNIPKNFDVKN